MTSSPPTLTGFNNNVRYRGMRFHIQTEDSGITRPHITTQLFADGGYVIKSLRTDYREYVDHPERAVLVHRLMRDQHRAMALDLRDGKLDATIDRIAPAPAELSADVPAADEPRPASAIPASAVPPSASHSAPLTEASPVPPTETCSTASSAERVSATVHSGALSADATSEHPLTNGAMRGSASSEAVRPPSQPRPEAEAGAVPARTAASSRRDARAAEAAPNETTPSSSRAAPSSRASNQGGAATLRPPSSRKPRSSARPPSQHGSADQPASSSRTQSSKAAPRHRVIPVGEAPASSKTNPSAGAADRASSARRPAGSRASGSHTSGGHAATTQRPPSTQKSPTSRGTSSQRPPSSRKPARAGSRPAFTAAALAPSSKPKATPRSASASDARPPSSRTPATSARPPSSRGAATSSKRPAAKLSAPPAPSSRRAGRPSPVLTPAKGSKSIFGPLPQESLDDAILGFAATVKNGPPTRGSK